MHPIHHDHQLDPNYNNNNRQTPDHHQHGQLGPQSNDRDHHGQLEAHMVGHTTRPFLYPPTKSSSSRKTSLFAWLCAVLCAIMWALIIIGGLTVLVVYLLWRPKSPRFEISDATLNGAYLDTGMLLNADLTILANFTNPNRKVDVTFRYIVIDAYFGTSLIATQGVDRFSEHAGDSTLRSIHLVSSEVALPKHQADLWSEQVGGSDGVKMEVKGRFLMTLNFVGTFLRLSYLLHAHCKIGLGAPPGGILLSSNCTTKR